MELGSNRGYCLWVVPPNEGKVRKFRFTLKRVAAACLFGILVAGLFVYVLGDYGRLQLLRLENYISLSKLASEHQKLLHNNQSLRSQVNSLQTAQNKNQNYEEDVKQRLEQLSSVIESATALGVFERGSRSRNGRPLEKDGVGGAEIDCTRGAMNRCGSMFSSSLESSADYLALSGVDSEKDLIRKLDHYIETLKVIPFGLPAKGDVSSGFGVRLSPFSHSIRMHEGIDFSLDRGSNIYSSAFGTVKSVERNPTYGLVIDVEHNNRVVTRYAHLSRALVVAGQKISRGEVIALAGSTGLSTGPHLHFEVLVDGRPRDPARFLELAKQLKVLV